MSARTARKDDVSAQPAAAGDQRPGGAARHGRGAARGFRHGGRSRYAYRDSALGIACGQTISQPFVVAYMTEQLQLKKDHRVLEIGTGSGYQAAVLSRLCRHVLTIERYRTLADGARARLEKLGYHNIEVMFGDGFDIPPGAGDFDRIIVTAAMEQIPDKLLAAARARRHPDRAGRAASRHPDAGPGRQDRQPVSIARNWSMSASCRRCRGSPANCRIPRLAVPANVLFRGLSGYLLATCLLKRVFCCVRVSNHVPYRRVASLASRAAGRGAGADVGWLCRLQRRYVDAPFRKTPSPIPLPRSPKRPARCRSPAGRAPRAAAIFAAAGAIVAIPVPGPAAARGRCAALLSGQLRRRVGRRARDFVLCAAVPSAA